MISPTGTEERDRKDVIRTKIRRDVEMKKKIDHVPLVYGQSLEMSSSPETVEIVAAISVNPTMSWKHHITKK